MSLNSIGKTAKDAKALKDISSYSDIYNTINTVADTSFYNIADSLKGLSVDDAAKKLNKLKLNPNLAGEILQTANSNKLLVGSVEEVDMAVKNLAQGGTSFLSNLGTSFTSILTLIKPFIPALTTIGGLFAAFKAYQWADDKFTLSFDTALKHAEESNAAYSQTSQELDTINSKLQTTQARIDELRNKGPLTPIDQKELDKLEQEETLQTTQSVVKKQTANEQKKKAAKDTKKALDFKSETIYEKDANNVLKLGADGDLVSKTVDRYGYIDDQIKSLEQAQQNIKDSQNELAEKPSKERKKQLEDSIKVAEKNVSDYKQTILSTISEMNEEASAGFYLDDGTLLPGYEDDVNKLDKWTDKVAEATGNLTAKQRESLNKLWADDSMAQAQQSIVNSLRNGENVTIDSITAQFPGLAAACDAAGISVEGLLNELQILASQEGATTVLEQAFANTSDSIQKATDNLSTLNSLQKESNSGSGLSSDGVAAFREMFGENADSALEKTANGYHINQEALAGLQQQQDALLKSDYLSTLNDQYTQLQSIESQLAAAEFTGQDTSGLEATREQILSQISSLEDLQYQYETANSAYNQWQAAMSGGEEGDMYDSISGSKDSMQDLYEQGLTGTNKFREYTDLLSSEDLSSASQEEVIAAYERLGQTIEGTSHTAMEFFQGGREGSNSFLETLSQLNSDWASQDENGNWNFGIDADNMDEIAETLGIDVEALQAILKKVSDYDYGFELDFEEPAENLENLKETALSAQEALAESGDSLNLNLDDDSLSGIEGQIETVEDYIQKHPVDNMNKYSLFHVMYRVFLLYLQLLIERTDIIDCAKSKPIT